MSSILKALNRLKNEAPKQDDTPSWLQEIDMKRAVRSDSKKGGFFIKFGYMVAAVVIFVGIGWLVYSQKPHLIKGILPWAVSSKEDKSEEKAKGLSDQSKSAKTVVSVRKKASLSGKPTSLRKKAAPLRNLSQKTALARKATKKPESPIPPREASKRTPDPLKRRKDLLASREIGPETELSSPSVSERRTKSNRYAQKPGSYTKSSDRVAISAEPVNDSKFKLQAVAWSDDPKKRIAVINDHVVKEGSSIEGAQVTHIGRDEVVVREGGKDYKLVFGLR